MVELGEAIKGGSRLPKIPLKCLLSGENDAHAQPFLSFHYRGFSPVRPIEISCWLVSNSTPRLPAFIACESDYNHERTAFTVRTELDGEESRMRV